MLEKAIRVLKIEPGREPYVKEIKDELKALQKEVGGQICTFAFEDGCRGVVNDEGKINGMEPNRWCGEDIICGPFFICGDNRKGDFISLTDEQVERYTEMFGEIPQFSGEEPELEPHLTFIAF